MSTTYGRAKWDRPHRRPADVQPLHTPPPLLGNYRDNPCWYCSVRDAGRTALVLGPFATEAACRRWAYRNSSDGGSCFHNRLVEVACQHDVKAWFYSWGMVKMANGYREGVLNAALPEAEPDMHYATEPTPGERLAAAIDALPLGEPDSDADNRDALRALWIGAAVALDCAKSSPLRSGHHHDKNNHTATPETQR